MNLKLTMAAMLAPVIIFAASFAFGHGGCMAAETSRIEPFIAKLKSAEMLDRADADKALIELAKSGLTVAEGLRLLDAARDDYPVEINWNGPTTLLSALLYQPRPEYVPVILKNFESYRDRKAQTHALAILAETDGDEAVRAFMELFRKHHAEDDLQLFPRTENALVKHASAAAILFPELLDLAVQSTLKETIYRILFYHLQQGSVTAARIAPWNGALLARLESHLAKLRPMQSESGAGWMWEEAYQESREPAGLMLDLVGHLDAPEVRGVLRACLALRDTKLKYFAAMHLLRLGETVGQGDLDAIAADGEMRGFLHGRLASMGKLALMAERFRTQGALAEADMIHWLTYPTELARVPDEIELMAVVAGKRNTREAIYLYRFRTHPPHWAAEKGWTAGIAGPFPRQGPPVADGGDQTFSSFEKWDSASPDEHVKAIVDILDNWREQQ